MKNSKNRLILVVTGLSIISAILFGNMSRKNISQDLASNDKTTSKNLPKLVELGSNSCASCKAMAEVLKDLKQTHVEKINIVKIDVFEDQRAVEKYKIRAIPTQVVLNNKGNEVYRHEGFISKDDIIKKLSEYQLIN